MSSLESGRRCYQPHKVDADNRCKLLKRKGKSINIERDFRARRSYNATAEHPSADPAETTAAAPLDLSSEENLADDYDVAAGTFFAWAEDTGGCPNPNYVRGGLETARDIDAVVNYAAALPFVRPEGAVVVGQSAGGWGAIAYDSAPHPKVAAFVVMAGGRGGHMHNQRNDNCRPDLLADAAGHFGKTASTPMLWIYAANDSFFAPAIARALWHSFTTAGGKADLEQPGAYQDDGHHLFFGPEGSKIWGPLAERYLTERGISAD